MLRAAMKDSAHYVKVVEWSDEDQCFVGECPPIIGPCCHGDDEAEVYRQLCQIVDEWIETMKRDGQTLPPATAERHVAQLIAE
jgi:predicted RNase H-like HicB family nuclease